MPSSLNSKLIYWKWLLVFFSLATISGRLRKLVHMLTCIKSFDKIYCEHSFSRSTTCIMYMCFEKHWMLNIFGGLWASFWVSWDIREAVLNSFLDWPLLFAFCIVSYFLEDYHEAFFSYRKTVSFPKQLKY